MRWSVADGALATVMGTLTSGVFLTGLVLALGGSRLQIGVLAAVPPCATLMQLAGSYFLERYGHRKQLCFWASLASRLLWLPMIIVALLPAAAGISGETAVWMIALLIALGSSLGSVAGVAWMAWTKDLIPDESRIGFLSRRNFMTTLLSLALGMLIGLFLDEWKALYPGSLGGFLIVLSLALAAGFAASFCMARVPDTRPAVRQPMLPFGELLSLPLKDRNFRRVISFYVCWNVSVNLALPFFGVYMLQKLALPFWYVMALATISALAGLLCNGFWCRMKQRFGIKPVVFVATLADAFIPLCWLFVGGPASWMLVFVHLFGVFSAPLSLGPNNFVLRLAPSTRGSAYMAVFSAVVGPVSALAAVTGGVLAGSLTSVEWPLAFGGLQILFLLSFVGRLASLLILRTIQEPQSQPASEVVAHVRQSVGRVFAGKAGDEWPVARLFVVKFAKRENMPATGAMPIRGTPDSRADVQRSVTDAAA